MFLQSLVCLLRQFNSSTRSSTRLPPQSLLSTLFYANVNLLSQTCQYKNLSTFVQAFESIKMLRNIFLVGFLCALVHMSLCDRKNDALFSEYGHLDSKADFYSEEYLNGQQYTIETRGACKNFIKNWQKKPRSVDTKGTCIRVCDDLDCRGTCKYVTPNNGEQQLSQVEMSRKVVSIQGCFQNRGRADD